MSGLERGHQGNRVYLARAGYADWCVLVCARNVREARRLALPVLDGLTGSPSDPVTPLDVRARIYRHPDGGFVDTDYEGVIVDPDDYGLVGFASDATNTWYIADSNPKATL
jgi:hypothetical protein